MSYNKPKGFKGPRGTQLHDAIVDWTRFDLMPYIRTVFPDVEWDCVYCDMLMEWILTRSAIVKEDNYFYTIPGNNTKCPDGLWLYDSGCIVIEVGRCQADKWLDDQQVLHIGFDGQVDVINAQDDMVVDVAEAVRDYITELMALDPLSTHPCPPPAEQ